MTPIHSFALRCLDKKNPIFDVYNTQEKDLAYKIRTFTYKEKTPNRLLGCLISIPFLCLTGCDGCCDDICECDGDDNKTTGLCIIEENTKNKLEVKYAKKGISVYKGKTELANWIFKKEFTLSYKHKSFKGKALECQPNEDRTAFELIENTTSLGTFELIEKDPKDFVASLKLYQELSRTEIVIILGGLSHWLRWHLQQPKKLKIDNIPNKKKE